MLGRDVERKSSSPYWICLCDCGTTKSIQGGSLSTGQTKSCGCFRREWSAKLGNFSRGENHYNYSHGGSSRVTGEHPLYAMWHGMKQRCHNPKNSGWKYYGGRGIEVCEAWRNDFASFIADVGERPDAHSLDRIDPDGNYEPSNVRWASRKTQRANHRTVLDMQTKLDAALARIAELEGRETI